LAMAARGFGFQSIQNALITMDEYNDKIANDLKSIGFTGDYVVSYLNQMFPLLKDRIRLLQSNGYALTDYIKYMNVDGEVVAALRESGMTAEDIAVALTSARVESSFYALAKDLMDGGFTLKAVVNAIVKAGCRPEWVIDYMYELAPIKDLAKAMVESEISLSVIVVALQIAKVNNRTIYQIIREISTSEQQKFRDELSSIENKALGDDEVAIIVTIGTLRSSGFSSGDSASLLTWEVPDWIKASAMLILSGYEWDDVLGAVWDVYRAAIGVQILQTMVGSTVSNFMKDFQNYWKIGKIVAKIVKRSI
jgi:hypothetical protein